MELTPELEHLRRVRNYELARALPLFAPQSKILEIGAGSGWQAQTLAEKGFAIAAIDLAGSAGTAPREFPVMRYDGRKIPFPDAHFDMIFSSNVLEHIPHLDSFHAEMKRVLKPQGQAVHFLPSASWRFWTTLSYYAYVLKRIWARRGPGSELDGAGPATSQTPRRSLRHAVLPPRHGERGNFLTEMFWFSQSRWHNHFRAHGWKVEACYPTRLFYTGYEILNLRLPLRPRHVLSYCFGSACHIYHLRKL